MIGGRALLRALLQRALGARHGTLLGVAGIAMGAVAGLLTEGAVGPGTLRGPDLVGGMLRDFPGTARLAVGLAFAFRTASDASLDAQKGWTQPVLAAGATRESYLVMLIVANATAAALLFFVSSFAWALALLAQGAGPAGMTLVLEWLPVSLLWIAAACSFGGAAVALTTRAGTAQALMAALLILPIAILMSRGIAAADNPPAWLRLLFALRIPPADASLPGFSRLLVFFGGAALTALLLAHRLLRVR